MINSNQTQIAPARMLPTRFLPAERTTREEVLRQHTQLTADPLVTDLLNSSLSLTMILNRQRQAVFINEAFRARLGLIDATDAIGSRMGEYLGCIRAGDLPGGCGTTEACRDCGAAHAISCALSGRAAVRVCHIQATVCGRDLSLQLQASPFSHGRENFLMISASDIEAQESRRQLEQLFFHDVINTASGVQGILHFMTDSSQDKVIKDCLPIAKRASDTLIDELISQRDLISAESGELVVMREEVAVRDLLTDLIGMLARHPLASNRSIVLAPSGEDIRMTTDKTLLSRVLLNLIKNALEAVTRGGKVTISCNSIAGAAVFSVHNPTCMPLDVQHQLFQRSFSTKGAGRGFGTYSIRLLTEKYLNGKVSFASNPGEGTTFHASYPLSFSA